ncbi:MAG: serine/threonine-protein kinase [Acidobacteria bacterium]|nr:MAG: serine/threonine-protein kinase [Acidobacteriota bacterium]
MQRFELFERLGAGGMGEVYRARDTRLNRFVALKFLPREASPAARERFEREAQAVAALNHPHICVLYETGEDENGRPFLVLELLEGETLQARLARGPLAGDALLDAALEIAEALEAAHKQGILHRDLKPSNIWVLPGGHIKILDFGLARLTGEALSEAATFAGEAALLTSPGMAVGTAPYMSPEQARGEALDGRSDIFSFGAVLYEMASGRAAFTRGSSAETVSAILKEEPAQMAQLPPELGRMVARCLEKDPDLRYQSAADLRIELKRLRRGSTSGVTAAVPVAKKSSRGRQIAIAAAIAVVAGVAYWLVSRAATPSGPVRLSFRQLTFTGDVADAAISPDGRFLAEVHSDPAGTSLHLRSIANGSDVQIVPPGNGCCQAPTIAPDDSVVYFVANHVLESVPVLGGAVRTVAPSVCSGAGVAPDGSQIAYLSAEGSNRTSRLMLARPDGSQSRMLTQAPAGDAYDGLCWTDLFNPDAPAWSPDARTIAVTQGTSGGKGLPSLAAISVANGKTTLLARGLFRGIGNLAWLPGGRALVFTGGSSGPAHPQLWRVDWPGGEPLQLTDDLQGYGRVTASGSGAMALLHSNPQVSVWVQAKIGGGFSQLPGGGANVEGSGGLAWTPDGRIIATRTFGANPQLWLQSADGSQARALALTGLNAPVLGPAVAPDGSVFFNTAEPDSSNFRVWRTNLEGAQPTPVSPPNGMCCQLAFIRAGSTVAFMYEDDKANQSVWQAPVTGGAAKPLWSHHIGYSANAASPDGTVLLEVGSSGPVLLHIDSSGHVASATPVGLDTKTMLRSYGFTPDGRAITYIHRQGSVDNLWAFPLSGAAAYPLTHFTGLSIYAYAFSKDGRLAVSRGSQNTDVVLATGLPR